MAQRGDGLAPVVSGDAYAGAQRHAAQHAFAASHQHLPHADIMYFLHGGYSAKQYNGRILNPWVQQQSPLAPLWLILAYNPALPLHATKAASYPFMVVYPVSDVKVRTVGSSPRQVPDWPDGENSLADGNPFVLEYGLTLDGGAAPSRLPETRRTVRNRAPGRPPWKERGLVVPVFRCPDNPIITPADVRPSSPGFEVVGVFNAGVARHGDQVILLLRVAERPICDDPGVAVASVYDLTTRQIELLRFDHGDPKLDLSDPRTITTSDGTFLTSISHLRVARSTDGLNFQIDPEPALAAVAAYETFGIEDPRITPVDGVYYITYVAVSPHGVATALASTRDFTAFNRHGIIFCPENKDAVIIPDRINGLWYALHRPASPFSARNEIWIARSPDLLCWGNHRPLLGLRRGLWDGGRIGPGAVPFEIEQGWVEVYHGADANGRYCLGAVLLDSTRPWRVLARTDEPILAPQAPYETAGFFGNVVFTCGLLVEQARLRVYYGAADTSVCYAEIPLADVVAALSR